MICVEKKFPQITAQNSSDDLPYTCTARIRNCTSIHDDNCYDNLSICKCNFKYFYMIIFHTFSSWMLSYSVVPTSHWFVYCSQHWGHSTYPQKSGGAP